MLNTDTAPSAGSGALRRRITVGAGAAVCAMASMASITPADAAVSPQATLTVPMPQTAAPDIRNWSYSTKGVSAWGRAYISRGRVYVSGTVKDTAADKHSAQFRIVFWGERPAERREERVTIGGKGRTKSFSYNSQYRDVRFRGCRVNSYGPYQSCGPRKLLWG